MREAYHKELHALVDHVVEFTRVVETAIGRANTALLHTDVAAADSAIELDQSVQRLHAELDDRVMRLLVCQQPVASDLRTIVAALRMNADLERMGVLARHVAQVARGKYPRCAIPEQLRGTVLEMGQAAQRMITEVRETISAGDVESALRMDAEDDEMDRLQAALYGQLHDSAGDLDAGSAMDVSLIGRYYERFADHVVALARCVAFRAGRATLDQVPSGGAG